MRPNHSLNRTVYGRPPWPGRWYAVHFHRPGQGVLPQPARLARTLGRTTSHIWLPTALKQPLPSEPRPKALARLRAAATARLDLLLDAMAVAFALSGATVAAVLGKLLVCVILAGLAIGFVLRLKSRKAKLLTRH